MREIQKKTDRYSYHSAEALKRQVNTSIKDLFKSTLDMIELKFGKDFNGYADLRSKILRTGNNAIRQLEGLVDDRFNIEMIPEIFTVNFIKGKEGKNGKSN